MHPASPKVQLRDLIAAVQARVEYDASRGVDGYPSSPARQPADPVGREADGAFGVMEQPVPCAGGRAGDLFLAPQLAGAGSLEELRVVLGDCERCKLAAHRTNIVFGVGAPRAQVMFVGEGPGRDEDLQAEPFVGRAGRLLTEIITKGMRLAREEVYIANVVKCRPPENRNPEPDEVKACEPFLCRQVELIRPRVIVALGTFAAQALLGVRTPISRLRGCWHDYQGIRVMPTFHPAYLLRNPSDKRLVWEDIKAVMREVDLLPERR